MSTDDSVSDENPEPSNWKAALREELRERVASWIRVELSRTGRTQADLARFLQLQTSQLTRLLQGKRGLDIVEMHGLEVYFGRPLDSVEVEGVIGDGAWREVRPIRVGKHKPTYVPALHGIQRSYSRLQQQAFWVQSASADKFFQPEDIVYAVPYNTDNDNRPCPGDVLVVRRRRGRDLFQLTLKRIKSLTDPFELTPIFEERAIADVEEPLATVIGLNRLFPANRHDAKRNLPLLF